MKDFLSLIVNFFALLWRVPVSTYFVVRISIASHRYNYAKTLELLEKLQSKALARSGGKKGLPLKYRALKAECLLRTEQINRAKDLFETVRDEAKKLPSKEGQFIRHFSQYWLAIIRNDYGQVAYQSKEANRLIEHAGLLDCPSKNADPDIFEFDEKLSEAAQKANLSVEEYFKRQIIKK